MTLSLKSTPVAPPTEVTPVNCEPSPLKLDAVITPTVSTPPEFAVTAEPTTIWFVVAFKVLAVTIPVTVIPLGKLGAPFAPAFVIVPARIRPPVAPVLGLGNPDVFYS